METVSSLTQPWIEQREITDKTLVSIVIIFLNAEGFLEEAIESIFSQTYNNWELLLVDDGSNDRSTEIALQYCEWYPQKVRYLEHLSHQNQGMPASRNLGINNASGEYVAFLDADDVWLPYKLEQQVAILDAHPEAGMIYGLSQWWYSWTGKPEDSQRDFVHELGVPPMTLIRPPQLLFSFFFRQEAAIPSPSDILLRRKALKEVGGFEEIFRGLYEDQALYAKIALNSPVIGVNTCWDRYRQHDNSSCAVAEKAGQEYETRTYFFNWLDRYLTAQGVNDPEIYRALRKEVWNNRHPNIRRLSQEIQQVMGKVKTLPFRAAERILPSPLYNWLKARWHGQEFIPPPGWARFGNLQRVTPLSREFGFDRGLPIDRYYIEKFLSAHQSNIGGHVLEIAEDSYTRRFGGERVTKSDILHVEPGTLEATIIADLTSADHIPANTFDCIILTQTLQFIYDVPAAIKTVHRILKPGGVALVTVPGLSPVSRYDMDRWGYYWCFSTLSARKLFEESFPPGCVQIQAFGNVLTAASFLFGMAADELSREELDYPDPDYELIITIRAEKPVLKT